MEIHPAQESDASALQEIVERAYAVYVERIGRRPAPMDDDLAARIRGADVFVAEDDGEIIGLIVLVVAENHVLVETIAIDPGRQGEGVGRALMAHAEAFASERHIAELRLYTNVAMTENLTFYPRIGYREDDRRDEDGFSRVYFSKRLGRGAAGD